VHVHDRTKGLFDDLGTDRCDGREYSDANGHDESITCVEVKTRS